MPRAASRISLQSVVLSQPAYDWEKSQTLICLLIYDGKGRVGKDSENDDDDAEEEDDEDGEKHS